MYTIWEFKSSSFKNKTEKAFSLQGCGELHHFTLIYINLFSPVSIYIIHVKNALIYINWFNI